MSRPECHIGELPKGGTDAVATLVVGGQVSLSFDYQDSSDRENSSEQLSSVLTAIKLRGTHKINRGDGTEVIAENANVSSTRT